VEGVLRSFSQVHSSSVSHRARSDEAAAVSFDAIAVWNFDDHDGEESLRSARTYRIVGAGPVLKRSRKLATWTGAS